MNFKLIQKKHIFNLKRKCISRQIHSNTQRQSESKRVMLKKTKRCRQKEGSWKGKEEDNNEEENKNEKIKLMVLEGSKITSVKDREIFLGI